MLGSWRIFAQEFPKRAISKKVPFSKDSIFLEKFSINPLFFEIKDKKGNVIDSTLYAIDFQKAALIFKDKAVIYDSIQVNYTVYPEFLTKKYRIFDSKKVVDNAAGTLVVFKKEKNKKFTPFEGLNTSGSISRGVTIGNNQNAVVNSNLDLQISGKISEKVTLRASIQDSNIPLQEGGYSQKIDEFDQLFMEMFSDSWKIRAGDLFLENRNSKFLNFNKKVQGIAAQFNFGTSDRKATLTTAAALVRGQYAKSNFVGKEGNQGPYKLKGANGELYVLVISGSESVYVNGILKKRGENNDYTIDYNAGELTFTSLFPITSEMRITIEYQYSDRNYSRFISYFGWEEQRKNWKIASYLYSENDLKNQPLQQNLAAAQVEILANAGDNQNLMSSPSAYLDSYSENKILYKKTTANGITVFEYSNSPTDELYNVRFSLVGTNSGNYRLKSSQAIGKIYEFIPPIAGVSQGNYEPISRLIAPTKLQIATLIGRFEPSKKTNLDFEMAVSRNDLNLFSSIDDENNVGFAGKWEGKHRFLDKKTKIDGYFKYQNSHENFRTVERLNTIEFNRDWNIATAQIKSQRLLTTGFDVIFNNKGTIGYQFEKLGYGTDFSGDKQQFSARITTGKWKLLSQSSSMNNKNDLATTVFVRSQNKIRYAHQNKWIGAKLNVEQNSEKLKATQQFSALSQKFVEYGGFLGKGDSTKVFVELGLLLRKNDSLQLQKIVPVNQSTSVYLKSQLLKNEIHNLSIYLNYRTLNYTDPLKKTEPSLNSRILYTGRFWNQILQSSSAYETNSGSIAQQEFTYLEVQPGQGIYMWNDYNANGIQELQEFEVAPFPDLAKYVRVFLPNQIYLKTHQNKIAQTINLNFNQWQNKSGLLQFLAHFQNQTSYILERKTILSASGLNWNPFATKEKDIVGLQENFRNSLFFNRGKQEHSTTLSYLKNKAQNLLSTGSVSSENNSIQLQYQHRLNSFWLVQNAVNQSESISKVENYASRNYKLKSIFIEPKISYLFSKNASLDLFLNYQKKENQMGNFEQLQQQKLGTSFLYNSEKGFSTSGEFSFYSIDFEGNALSAVGFQMLEGLQPGKNQTWRLLFQKNLTSFLDLSVNYQGRSSETNKTIHSGTIQLRAFF